jgi:hypothetical protein
MDGVCVCVFFFPFAKPFPLKIKFVASQITYLRICRLDIALNFLLLDEATGLQILEKGDRFDVLLNSGTECAQVTCELRTRRTINEYSCLKKLRKHSNRKYR